MTNVHVFAAKMPRLLSWSHLYRRRKLLLAIALFGVFILPNLSGPGHHLTPDIDKITEGGFLRRLVGLEDPAAVALQRRERAMYAERTYGEKCGLDQLGVPPVVREQGCMGPMCEQLTCKNLLFGSGSEPYYDFAMKWMNIHPIHIKPDAEAGELAASNCSAFIKVGGYRMDPPTAIEGDIKIAYNLLVHRDVEQVELLLQAIYRPQNIYCVHVDAKAVLDIKRSIAAIVNCLPNMYLVSQPVRIVYAGYSRLQADINCMQDQVSHPVKWQYLINQPGQAFPLKTNEEIVQILRIYNGANDIEGIYGPRVIRNRFEKVWEERDINTNLPKLEHNGEGKNPPPYNLDILKGNVYGIFSRAFVEWVLEDKIAKALLQWSINTWSPDEHYWATLHHTFTNPQLNPPGGFADNPNSKPWLGSFISWFYGEHDCHGKYVHGICIFGIKDLPVLTDRLEMFVNKLFLDYQPLVFACLKDWISYKWKCPPRFQKEFYQSIPFIIPKNQTASLEGM